MVRIEYMFPYGAMKLVDPLIGVETEFGWVKQRLSNLTDFYLVTNKEGSDCVVDLTRAKFYKEDGSLVSLEDYAKEYLTEFFEYVGITMHVYAIKS